MTIFSTLPLPLYPLSSILSNRASGPTEGRVGGDWSVAEVALGPKALQRTQHSPSTLPTQPLFITTHSPSTLQTRLTSSSSPPPHSNPSSANPPALQKRPIRPSTPLQHRNALPPHRPANHPPVPALVTSYCHCPLFTRYCPTLSAPPHPRPGPVDRAGRAGDFAVKANVHHRHRQMPSKRPHFE